MQARDYYEQGLSKKNAQAALEDFKQAILLDENYIEAYEAFYKLGRRMDVVISDADIEKLHDYAFRLGVLYQIQGRISESLERFHDASLLGGEKYIRCDIDRLLEPQDVAAMPAVAMDFVIYAYKKFIELCPERALPYYNVALVYQKNNQAEAALAVLLKAKDRLKEFDFKSYYHLALGAAYLALDDIGNAKKSYHSALDLEPTKQEKSKAHMELAFIYQKANQSEEAKLHLDQAKALVGSVSAGLYQSFFQPAPPMVLLTAEQKMEVQGLIPLLTDKELCVGLTQEVINELGNIYSGLKACLNDKAKESDVVAALKKANNFKNIPDNAGVQKVLETIKTKLNAMLSLKDAPLASSHISLGAGSH
ncbi:MAG: hypothetical protein P4M14_12610 [Gammaproteobacteria bacterium]|nr:hypothetical protein [Gammaproteobacteria bacterium]